jgi:cyclase
MQQITTNVFVENKFRGCNTSLVVTSDGVVIIDTPMVPEDAKKWRAEAERHGRIRYVINTEPHTDHASGNCWFGAPVISHEGTRQELLSATKDTLVDTLKGMSPESLPLDPAFHYQLPEIVFSQNLTFYLGQHTFHLLNLPGHTASELAVYVPEEKVVFTGDNLNLMMPIFVKSFPHAWLKSLQRLGELSVTQYVPGHGNVSDRKCLSWMAGEIQYWINAIQGAIDRGLSLEETLKQVTFAEKIPLPRPPFMETMLRNSVADVYKALKA